MSVAEVRDDKAEVEQQLTKLIREFEERHDVVVTGISYNRVHGYSENPPGHVSIEVWL